MKLIKWEPFNELDRFFDDRLFPAFPRFGWDLAVDVYEEKDNMVAKMSLPGIKPEELDVSIEDNILTISGVREEESEIKNKNYYSKEIRRGSFSRSVSLPKAVEASKAEAKYQNGILSITVPIVEGAKEKSIKVKVMA